MILIGVGIKGGLHSSINNEAVPLGTVCNFGERSSLQIALIYVLMILALAALCVPGPPRALLVISTIGFAVSSLAKFRDSTFRRAFGYYGHMQQWHMSRGPAWWILPCIMPVLVAICFAKTLDEPDPESRGD